MKAVEQHCKPLLDGETFCDRSTWDAEAKDTRLPEHWRSLIAFAMDGDSEGYYVHIGVMVDFGSIQQAGRYVDIGSQSSGRPRPHRTLRWKRKGFCQLPGETDPSASVPSPLLEL